MLTKESDSLELLFNATLWVLFLTLVLPIITTFIVFLSGIGSLFLDEVYTVEQLETNLGFNLATSIVSAILLLPIIKYSLSANNKESIYSKLALKP